MEKKEEEGEGTELKVSKIKDGTVIDHAEGGYALDVVRILRVDPKKTSSIITIAMNVPSKRLVKGRKDIIKIEGMKLNLREIDMIAVVAPKATINRIENFEVISKHEVKLPSVIEGIVQCPNETCISNSEAEPVKSKFYSETKAEQITFRCHYCGEIVDQQKVVELII